MITQPRLFSLLAVALLAGCGGSHGIGNEVPCSAATRQNSCPASQACDVDGLCRQLCGPNAPGSTCATGTVCVSYVCRPTCTATAASSGCPTGFTCGQGVCLEQQPQCSASIACPQRQACVSGTCQSIGSLCGDGGQCSGASEYCDQGVCRVWCGANYPNNFCATGETCQNSICRP